jgi:Skp family chaperone for outer membrane proteins
MGKAGSSMIASLCFAGVILLCGFSKAQARQLPATEAERGFIAQDDKDTGTGTLNGARSGTESNKAAMKRDNEKKKAKKEKKEKKEEKKADKKADKKDNPK